MNKTQIESRAGYFAAVSTAAFLALSCSAAGETGGNGAGGATGAGGGQGVSGGFNLPVGTGGGVGECGGDRYDAEAVQLDMYVMFDDSASMIPWWIGVTDAFTKFLNDPISAGIGVGIQFFGSECDPNYYATPRVPIAPLPGNAAAVIGAFPLPFEGTPTEPALRGAIQHARAWHAMHPDRKVVVLLVTDGSPSDCNSTVDSVAAVAAEGLNGTPSIQTFVLGLGLNLNNLQQIAAAGGTGQAFIVDPNSGQALAEAMNQIRGVALPCDYALPNGGNVDPSKLNIEFSPDGQASRTIPNVRDSAGCASGEGWYYDNPTAPTRAITCPSTCETFKATAAGEVKVVLGCDIVVK